MLALLGPDTRLPDPEQALHEPNGLLAAGLDLSAERLLEAYRCGIFPWYTAGQPVLWWSPDPRMVLALDRLHLSHSLRKTLRARQRDQRWHITLDACFERVMQECAAARTRPLRAAAGAAIEAEAKAAQTEADAPANPPAVSDDTWITADIRRAYSALHRLGAAHSVEVWNGPRLVGGLYGVSIGRMFFGESMFARETDASKTALVALVQVLRRHGFCMIDCQQKTRHLASLGAHEMPRKAFLKQVDELAARPAPDWRAMQIGLPHA